MPFRYIGSSIRFRTISGPPESPEQESLPKKVTKLSKNVFCLPVNDVTQSLAIQICYIKAYVILLLNLLYEYDVIHGQPKDVLWQNEGTNILIFAFTCSAHEMKV